MFLPMNTKPRPAGSRWHRFLRHAHGVTRTSSREHASRGYVVREIIFLSLYVFLPLLLATALGTIRLFVVDVIRFASGCFVVIAQISRSSSRIQRMASRERRTREVKGATNVRTHESVIIRDFWLDARLRSVCARFASSESVC